MRRCGPALAGVLAASLVVAAPTTGGAQTLPAERAAARFPQAVRVGDLPGRDLLTPTESQNVLGRVAAVERTEGGALVLLVARGGVLGFRATHVLVPVADVALLGEHVTLIGMSRTAFEALPRAEMSGLSRLAPDATIEVAVTGPFH